MVKKGVCSSVTKNLRESRKILANRLLALIILIAVLYCVLIGRVFVLQIVEGQSHKMILHIKYKRQSRHLVPEEIFMM